MEFGNVYEVFEPGDLVKINNVRNIHCGRTGTIIGISHTGPNDVCRPFQFTRLMAALSGLLMIQMMLVIFCILTMPNMFWPNISGDLDLMVVELS